LSGMRPGSSISPTRVCLEGFLLIVALVSDCAHPGRVPPESSRGFPMWSKAERSKAGAKRSQARITAAKRINARLSNANVSKTKVIKSKAKSRPSKAKLNEA
jgi:hypothetical protein